jgi:cyclopropane fatty-acyl-phospholipid synthase-like methyltransferase
MEKKEWFAEWFDTRYYHILYKNRDDKEAERFIDNLCKHLGLKKDAYALDLACGKGRHSVTLNKHGYKVLGADLSAHSINEASQFSKEGLEFVVQDMRIPIEGEKFDAIFNLFTSFGYFDEMGDNIRVIQSANTMLDSNGLFVIDFMNANRVIHQLVEKETKEVDGIVFHITREYDGQHIFKHIRFHADNHDYNFTERVQALKYADFEKMLTSNGFKILSIFGDFDLNTFDENSSDRLILIAQKN